ncbi:MAG: SMC-Scp complex subunit ScpB, partial [Pseudomonadota bacterium]|nr:SMC-Scp complex subunit ScpB [Pseudomonadota bacterium]
MANEWLTQVLEAAILAHGPISRQRLYELLEPEKIDRKGFNEAMAALQERDHAVYELKEVASGFRFQVKTQLAKYIQSLAETRPPKYSRALLETLVLIAYRQPITRSEIEDVRGVAVSSQIIKALQERDWVKVIGHKDVPGRPALYATTKPFLDYFQLGSLQELPTLAEIRSLEQINSELDLNYAREEQQSERAVVVKPTFDSEVDVTDEYQAVDAILNTIEQQNE